MKMEVELIVTDMDGTAVKYPNKPFYSSWDALAEIFDEEKRKDWSDMRDKYLAKGNGFYREWFEKQVFLLEGISVSEVEKILFPIPYAEGFKEFFSSLDWGIKKAILSAGVDMVSKKIAKELDFDYCISQYIGVKKGFFTGRGKHFKGGLDKSKELIKLCSVTGTSPSKTCYIGDMSGDISCFELVGFPVAFEPKYGLEEYVKEKNIPSINDFRKLKNILK